MPGLMLLAEERSFLYATAPSAQEITTQLGRARQSPTLGAWVGPGPRITRASPIGGRFATKISWLWALPEGMTDAQFEARRRQLTLEWTELLQDITASAWATIGSSPYSPAVNGSVAWWRSGEAARTRTRESFPETAERFVSPENPWGPTTPETTTLSIPGAVQIATESMTVPLLVIGGLALLVVLGPTLLREMRSASPRRARA